MADDWNETIQEMEAARKARDLTRKEHEVCCPACYRAGIEAAKEECVKVSWELSTLGQTEKMYGANRCFHRIRALADKPTG